VNKKLAGSLAILFLISGIVLYAVPSNTQVSQNPEKKDVTWNGYSRECEYPDNHSVGQMIHRSRASGQKVHGQFGCDSKEFFAKAGYVEYHKIKTPKLDNLFLGLYYSKNSESSQPIEIYLDNEKQPRISFFPENQGDWNKFSSKDSIGLGEVEAGLHTLIFKTSGQDYGVLDLDKFYLFK